MVQVHGLWELPGPGPGPGPGQDRARAPGSSHRLWTWSVVSDLCGLVLELAEIGRVMIKLPSQKRSSTYVVLIAEFTCRAYHMIPYLGKVIYLDLFGDSFRSHEK